METLILKEYLPVLFTAFLAMITAISFLLLARFVGEKSKNPVKTKPFECGSEPVDRASKPYGVRIYLYAVLFVILDIELVFLYPWAVSLKKNPSFFFGEMIFFLIIVVGGFVYAWGRGAIDLERFKDEEE